MTDLLPAERRARIVEQTRAHGSVRVADLAQSMGVSEMTVRRDLDQLAGQGELRKVHGGARLAAPGSASEEPGFVRKSRLNQAQKSAVARAAAALAEPGMSVFVNSGTTTFALARELREVADLTVVTNSPRIAQVFEDRPAPGGQVVMLGGVRTPSDALVGPLAVRCLETLHADVCFMGVHGFDMEAGLSTPNMLEAQVNRMFLEHAHRRVVVADSTKSGTVGLYGFADLDAVDDLITDWELPDAVVAELEEKITRVHRVV
ncbi:DeoR/GlpR family DNA-binding transcription regulator [Kocuria coralli]|uniref:DeoR/GlpR family DNA-binding transcription regulator n=1 Tax=Kocuria coralli TaxID=1461025 RepID=UPI001C6FCF98|nr:DeoR/GlpR family DNA-binding transcription regulator [Kocuria coralli]